jgi:sugar phosphate permease
MGSATGRTIRKHHSSPTVIPLGHQRFSFRKKVEGNMVSIGTIGAPASTEVDAVVDDDKLFTRVMWRILPLVVGAYFLAYLDRTNISFAQLQMNTDLGFSAAIYGFGAGVFFISYCLFEVPSNLVLERIGARKTLFSIMFLWGLAASATAFVTTPTQFYIVRFLLGVVEAGIFPGVIYYLGLWLPAKRRAEGVAFFLMATIVSGILGGPLSGWLMTVFDGAWGWRGWHWLLVLEGLPSSLYAIFVYFTLSDRPSDAKWLSSQERAYIAGVLAAEDTAARAASTSHTFLKVMADPKLYVIAATGFMTLCSVYAIMFWIPQMIRNAGVDNLFHIGLYAMVPHAVTIATMYIVGRHSDRTLERRWHFAIMVTIGAAGLMLCTMIPSNLPLTLIGLAISEAALNSVLPLFWAIARGVLTSGAAAGGLGFVGSIANFGGFVAPSIIGVVQTATGSLSYGLRAVAIITLLGAAVMLLGVRKEAMAAESVKN